MRKLTAYQTILFVLLTLFTITAFAWDHSIELGYGISHDPNHSRYNNSGFLLNGDIYHFLRTPVTLWSINGAIGQWYSSAPVNKHLTTAALSVALRYYPFVIADRYPAYLLGSVGPAYLSNRHFGLNTQAGNATFQWNVGLGAELHHIDLNFRWSHFSNAYLARPDQGFTVLYLFSIGYLF